MKGLNTLLIFALMLCLGATTLNAQNVNIPSASFKAYLVGNTAINTNGDSEIQVSEATAFSGAINFSHANVSDFTGIEAFVNLTELYCHYNNLTTLDLSQNVNLIYVQCQYNPIVSLDLSQNVNLLSVNCAGCALNSFNVKNGNNANMYSVYLINNPDLNCIEVDNVAYATLNWSANVSPWATFSTNCGPPSIYVPDVNLKAYLVGNPAINTNGDNHIQFTEATAFSGTIDCSNLSISNLRGLEYFPNLTVLDCSSNNISSISLEQNLGLQELNCANNNLTALELTQNTNLTKLDCSFNPIVSIDLSQNTSLVELASASCDLSSLDLRNGNNTNMTAFNTTNNFNLICINVDDEIYSTTNWTNVDATVSFNTNCGASIVYIPDVNFKAYLVGDPYINTNGDAEIQYAEAIEYSRTNSSKIISCPNSNITDMTGIEAFVNVKEIYCNNNSITTLDVTRNSKLIVLHCVNNNIASLDVTQNPYLKLFYCSNNSFSTIDLTQNSRLEKLYIGSNQLSSLDLNQNSSLKVLDCARNQLSNLKLKNGNNTNVTTFNAVNNAGLACIEVDDVAYSTTNWTNIDATATFNTNCNSAASAIYIPNANFKASLVGNTSINTNNDTEIQVSEAVAFSGLIDCSNLNITDLTGLEEFVNLTGLNCSSNNLTSFDLSINTSLTSLDCANNQLTSLNLNQNTSLTSLNCSSNSLDSLDLTQNTNLTTLNCSSNQLLNLELIVNTNLTALDASSNILGSLNVKNGNNANMTVFNLINNPLLSCIDVDNAAYSSANWTNIDAGISFSVDCSIQNVYIPDAQFKAHLIANPAINTNGDTEIQFSEALAFNGIMDCSANRISDLTGIEAFVNITQLKCNRNFISTLDLSQNTQLTRLYCYNNRLTSLNVTQNTSLIVLHCVNNYVDNLDLTQNVNLTTLYCAMNPMYNLDLSQNTSLRILDCHRNQLSTLNIRNGNNANMTTFVAYANASLSCIEVDDASYSTANWLDIDAVASFSTNCVGGIPVVNIPDVNFKAYLIANPAINTNGDAEIQFSEAAAFTGGIVCDNSGITSLVGVEEFVNLTELDCSSNALTSFDLSQNTSLTSLDCSSNQLNDLDLSQNTSLVSLDCSNNQLNDLDLSSNTSLASFDCSSNTLSSLDVRSGGNTIITAFNATNNPNLSCIQVDNATYSTTNWLQVDATASFNTTCNGAPPTVTILDANFKAYLVGNAGINTNGDTEIQVSEAVAFSGRINCPNLNIADLTGVEAFVNLTQLVCYNNNLTSIDIRQNTNLNWLHCVRNSLTSLDVTQNTNLSMLYCSNNPISSLGLSQNTNLTKLYARSTQLNSLNMKNGNNTSIVTFSVTSNPNLSCIEVDNVNYSTGNWTSIDAGVSFSTNCTTPRLAQNPTATTGALAEKSAVLNNSGISNQAMPLSVYPNPTRKGITVNFGKTYKEASLQVSNVTGQIVLQRTLTNSAQANLELEGATGIYFIQVQTEEGSRILKVIKE